MTNPLLQPDGRFRRDSIVDSAGRNRFADEQEQSTLPDSSDVLTPPGDVAQPSYHPHYATHYPHRGQFIAWLGGSGFFLTLLVLLVFTRYALIGFFAAVVGVSLSLATVVVGYRELSGMTSGAVDPSGRGPALLGFRLALASFVLGVGALVLTVGIIVRIIMEL